MNNKRTFFSLLGAATFALTAFIVLANHSIKSSVSYAGDSYIEKTLNPADLEKCTFEQYTFNGKNNSRKFKYEMSGGKFIEGAILFGDCDYQYVGNNLSEPFGINNTSKGNQNSDFHIFFNAHGLLRAEFRYTAQLNNAYSIGIPVHERVKFTDKCESGLYNELSTQTYSNITKEKDQTDFYLEGNAGGYELKTTEVHSDSIYWPKQGAQTLNAVAFQLNATTVPKDYGITFTLTKVILRYTC